MTPVMLSVCGFILITDVGWVGSIELCMTEYACLPARVASAGTAKRPWTKANLGPRTSHRPCLWVEVGGYTSVSQGVALSLRGRQEGSAVTPLTAMQIYLSLCRYLAYQFCSPLL